MDKQQSSANDEQMTDKLGKDINVPCKWCQDEFCTNGDSPMRADYCPVPDIPGVCLHEERAETQHSGKNSTTSEEECQEVKTEVKENVMTADPIRFTEEKVEDARAIIRLFPWREKLARSKDGSLAMLGHKSNGWWEREIVSGEAFPSIKHGQSVRLSGIVGGRMNITLLEYPTEQDWLAVKQRALVTAGLNVKKPPALQWKLDILNARHSPIRRLRFAFLLEDVPSWVSVHLVRHVHAQPDVKSQRNDRQKEYDRNKAPQDVPVNMIWDMNGEELMVIANKRLCMQASEETRDVIQEICNQVVAACPEFKGFLLPMCEYHGGVCREINPCGRCPKA